MVPAHNTPSGRHQPLQGQFWKCFLLTGGILLPRERQDVKGMFHSISQRVLEWNSITEMPSSH